MAKLRVHNLDGYVAGPDQSLDAPLRVGGERLGLVDEMHVAVVPVLLGRGVRLFEGLPDSPPDHACTEVVSSPAVVHIRMGRRPVTPTG